MKPFLACHLSTWFLNFFSFKMSGYILNSWRLLMILFYVYFYHLILRINHLSNIRLFEEYLFHEWNSNFKLPWTSVKQFNKVSSISIFCRRVLSLLGFAPCHMINARQIASPLSEDVGGEAYITVSEFLPHSLILHISVRGRDNWAHGTCPMFTQKPGLQSWGLTPSSPL